MPITPLPQFEADLEEIEREKQEFLERQPPRTVVARFGVMRLIGEFPFKGDVTPGCGSTLVIRTFRGIELGELLTSNCPNAGCGKSVTRKEMLEYIDRSGGKDYPFYSDGKVLRVATVDDLNEQRRIEGRKAELRRRAQELAGAHGLEMTIIEAEPILGGERLTFFFGAEERIDFRELVHDLAREFSTRIDLRQVGARDEARITADYERCGQHCCCKQFLKVLKPVSMRAAKTQKASLDPLKISGRCGRLMCCLRYENETYETLRKKLPKMKARVGSAHGVGIVIDRQILTQLVKLRLEHDESLVAVPVEELCSVEEAEAAVAKAREEMRRASQSPTRRRSSRKEGPAGRGGDRDGDRKKGGEGEAGEGAPGRKRRRRRRKRRPETGDAPAGDAPAERPSRGPRPSGGGGEAGGGSGGGSGGGGGAGADGAPKKKRRRRRRRRKPGDGGGAGGGGGDGGSGGGGSDG
jgi:cell fate regulator YaaT (PSP1 superfamily)